MPISPIVIQRRHAELGRIRLGYKADTSSGKTRPAKLEMFRFTSPSERYIRDLAELYGGEAREWDNNGKAEWEVYTQAKSIPVIAVKGGLSQWMETWSGGGCAHRCDGERDVEGNLCNPNDPQHANAKPTTRLSVMLPELEAIGAWRMETHGWNAAAEIPAVAELAQFVGDLVPAHLHLVERRSVKNGQTSRFVVPVLDLQIGTARLREIVAAKSGTTAPELEGPQRPALSAPAQGPDEFDDYFDMVADATDLQQLADIWDSAREKNLVGTAAAVTPRNQEFIAAWKARAQELKAAEDAAQTSAPPASEPDADGVVDAELVDEDPDAIWRQILTTAGQQGMTETALREDFAQQMGGLDASEASPAELATYLTKLEQGAAA